jgi:hypothetical protein
MDEVSLLSYVLATFHYKDETLTVREISDRLSAIPNVPKTFSDRAAPIKHTLYTSGTFTLIGDPNELNPAWTLHEKNPKGRLQELVQGKSWPPPPTYATRESGPGWFMSTLLIGQVRFQGLGRSKRVAEENAARIALATSGNTTEDKLVDVPKDPAPDVRLLIAKWAAEAHPALSREMKEWLDKQ